MKYWGFCFLVLMTSPQGFSKTLHELVKNELNAQQPPKEAAFSTPPAIVGYVPIQSFEFRTGYDSLDEDYDANSNFNQTLRDLRNMTQALRMNMKSFKEMSKTQESLDITRDLIKSENASTLNESLFQTYQGVVERIFNSRLVSVLGDRQELLSALIEKNSLTMGLTKVNTKFLVDHLEQQQKVEGHLGAVKAREKNSFSPAESEALSRTLLTNISSLKKKLLILEEPVALELKTKNLENRLDRLHQEVNWANDEKVLSFFELKRDQVTNDTAFRLGLTIPWIRFDGITKARERAMMHVKERAFERQSSELKNELRIKLAELQAMGAQVEALASRLDKTRSIEQKLKGVKDVELKTVMSDFTFETELDVLLLAYEFYLNYLEYLKDMGTFAHAQNQDLLHADWQSFSL